MRTANGRVDSFPERLRLLREMQGWSQFDLAGQTGKYCSRRTIQNWESGFHSPRVSSPQLRSVAEVLRVDVPSLLFGKERKR